MKRIQTLWLALFALAIISCNNQSNSKETSSDSLDHVNNSPSLKIDEVSYNAENKNLKAYIVYDSNLKGQRPGILVVHEWWGMNDYPKMRARKLAELGYVAMAVDLYGDGKTVESPDDAGKMSGPYYSDPQMAKRELDVFLNELKKYPQVDTTKLGAIGYCFGGGMVLNYARLGADLDGVVSFHGNLLGTPPKKELLKSKLLVCHGENDQFVKQQEVQQFKKQMDSVGAIYEFKQYPNSTHAFTNPAATEKGKKYNLPIAYNGAADTASWNDMKEFFERVFK